MVRQWNKWKQIGPRGCHAHDFDLVIKDSVTELPSLTVLWTCTVWVRKASLIPLLMGGPRPVGWGREGGECCWTELWSSLPSPGTAFPLSHKDDKFLLFWISEKVWNGFPEKIPTESAFGTKVLISFGDFQTWNMGLSRDCALVSWGSGGYFYNANYYFMTVIYFMLSAVYTREVAIVLGIELVGLSGSFSKTNLTVLWV